MTYDSTQDTKAHIARVRELLMEVMNDLNRRFWAHDRSKLEEPEKSIFDVWSPKLRAMEYSTDPESEYQKALKEMGVGLQHHYEANDHHPEWVDRDIEWRPIPMFEGRYEISSKGDVKSLPKVIGRPKKGDGYTTSERILKLMPTPKGYLRVQLINARGRQRNFMVHRLVAVAFIPNPDGKPEVNHENGIKSDNRVDNLEWATASENQQHAYDTGLKEPSVKYVVHCPELDVTAMGTQAMERLLHLRGYDKVDAAGIWRAIHTGGKHLQFTFEGSLLQEHRRTQFSGMALPQIMELLVDWKAAGERHAGGGDLRDSIEKNAERFGYGDEIKGLLINTAAYFGWL